MKLQPASADPLLRIANLRTHFLLNAGVLKAVDGVDLQVGRGEVLGLVGESGCGKTVLALSIAGLIDPPGRIVEGSIRFGGDELVGMPEQDMNGIRGSRIAMIFQQPRASLDPVMSIGRQIGQALRSRGRMDRSARRRRAIELLAQVGIPDPQRRVREYAHQMSGGMAQRVMIAIALAAEPDLLIADEPTTALDSTVQSQILELLAELQAAHGMAVILVTHDLGVVAELADRVAVMYAGRIVEESTTARVFESPLHPYTTGLMASRPAAGTRGRLRVIPGTVPVPLDLPPGCSFAPRCAARADHDLAVCTETAPGATEVRDDHRVRCWLHE